MKILTGFQKQTLLIGFLINIATVIYLLMTRLFRNGTLKRKSGYPSTKMFFLLSSSKRNKSS